MRKIVIAGNWKMHKDSENVTQFMEEAKSNLNISDKVDAIVCAPFPYLSQLVELAQGTHLKVAAQTMHYADEGAFTGEVSPVMLEDIGVTHVIIGHSERREYYNETDETVNKKIHAAFAHNLTPIVCVGETLEQREAKETLSHIQSQVEKAFADLSPKQASKAIIAYEPIWAIGTGKTASNADANEVCHHIREVMSLLYSDEVADSVVIQYGGSVKPENIDDLLAMSDIDGALVGGASLEASSFLKLVAAGKYAK